MTVAAHDLERVKLLLKLIAFLEHLTDAQLDALVAGMDRQEMRPGDVLVREGEPGDRFYIIGMGAVDVRKRRWFRDRLVHRLGPFNYFGELALLFDIPRTATVVCAEPGWCYVLSREAFRRGLEANPEVHRMILDVARTRLRSEAPLARWLPWGRGRRP